MTDDYPRDRILSALHFMPCEKSPTPRFLYISGGEKVEGFGEGRGKRITECIMRDKNRIQQNLICEKKGGVWTLPKSNGELLKVLK